MPNNINADQITAGIGGELPVVQWSDATAVQINGPDVANFLQGYLTTDSARLAQNRWQLTAFATIKGRVLANGWARLTDGETGTAASVIIVVHRSLAERLQTFLAPYLRFARSQAEIIPAPVLVRRTAVPDSLPPAWHDMELAGRDGYALSVGDDPGEDTPASANDSAAADDLQTLWLQHLIGARVAFVSQPVSEGFLPQVLGLHKAAAVDFDKGCYLGQEVIARAQFRGKPKRALISSRWLGESTPAAGLHLSPDGTVIQAVRTSDTGGIALIVARPEVLERSGEGAQFTSVESAPTPD